MNNLIFAIISLSATLSAFAFNFGELDNNSWKFCAIENKTCNFNGTRLVRYGADARWYYRVATNSTICSVREFGDPLPNIKKTCEVGDITAKDLTGPVMSLKSILYVTSDVTDPGRPNKSDIDLIKLHLRLAENTYEKILGIKINNIAINEPISFKGQHTSQELSYSNKAVHPGEILIKEYFNATGLNRISVQNILLFIIIRPPEFSNPDQLNFGGRSFNGGLNGGGGFIHMDFPIPNINWQSSLVHELGHALGLTHSDCLGYSLEKGESFMTNNPKFFSYGTKLSKDLGTLMPEEVYNLSRNKRFFPQLIFNNELYNPLGIDVSNKCTLPSMSGIGDIPTVRGVGYDLYFNGQIYSGPDSIFFTKEQAVENCKWNIKDKPSIDVKCVYQGSILTTQ